MKAEIEAPPWGDFYNNTGAPEASLIAQLVNNSPAMWETWVRSLGWEDPLENGKAIHSRFLPGEFHRQRSLAGYTFIFELPRWY